VGLDNIKIKYKPVLHGVGWPGDVKKIALKIDKLKKLGYTPQIKSLEAVEKTARRLVKELEI